jgi:uncharacterized protein (DUF1697 family)
MTRYVALLRGINVGGNNLIGMEALAAAFRAAGYDDVRTHLQSGNALFTSASRSGTRLESAIETVLQERFGTHVPVIVRSRDALMETIEAAPADHGSADLRSDVYFLKHPLTAAEVMEQMPALRDGVDSVAPGPGAIYFSRTVAQATKTRITRLYALPVFKRITVRSWRTTTRLLDLLDDATS